MEMFNLRLAVIFIQNMLCIMCLQEVNMSTLMSSEAEISTVDKLNRISVSV